MKNKYRKLLIEWKDRTKVLSNPDLIAEDPACKELISIGEYILPLIFEDLENGVKDIKLLILLREITGIDPIKEEHRGNIALMTNDWINQYGKF